MKNYINKHINNEVLWSKDSKGKITGFYIRDKQYKGVGNPAGYCASVEILPDGNLQIFTNGKYQFIEKKLAGKFFAQILGKLGGSKTSPKKKLSSKKNGKLGGRPKTNDRKTSKER